MSLESRVAGPVRSWLQSSLGRKPGHAFMCLVCFALVVICFLGMFLVKAPSLSGLIQGKRRFLSACMRKPECSTGRTREYWAEPGTILDSFCGPCFPSNFCSPSFMLLSSSTPKAVGAAENKPKTFFNPAKVCPTHQGKLLALGADTLLSSQVSSQGSSRVKAEELAPAKLDGAGQGARVA